MHRHTLDLARSDVGRERRPQRHRLMNPAAVAAPLVAEANLGSRFLPPAPGVAALVGDVDVNRLLHTRSHRSWQGDDCYPSVAQRVGVGWAVPGTVNVVCA